MFLFFKIADREDGNDPVGRVKSVTQKRKDPGRNEILE